MPALADALWKLVSNESEVLPDPVHYVLDGGALLQRVPWIKGETFDGYGHGPNTKNVIHLRHGQGSGPTVNLTPQTVVSMNKMDFWTSFTIIQTNKVPWCFLETTLRRLVASLHKQEQMLTF